MLNQWTEAVKIILFALWTVTYFFQLPAIIPLMIKEGLLTAASCKRDFMNMMSFI